MSPKDEMATLGLGLAFQGLGEAKEAMNWVMKSLEIVPDNKSALYTAVQIDYELEDYTQSTEALERYLQDHPKDHGFAYTLAGLYFSMGKTDLARSRTNAILAEDPQDEKALELIAKIEHTAIAEGGTL